MDPAVYFSSADRDISLYGETMSKNIMEEEQLLPDKIKTKLKVDL